MRNLIAFNSRPGDPCPSFHLRGTAQLHQDFIERALPGSDTMYHTRISEFRVLFNGLCSRALFSDDPTQMHFPEWMLIDVRAWDQLQKQVATMQGESPFRKRLRRHHKADAKAREMRRRAGRK